MPDANQKGYLRRVPSAGTGGTPDGEIGPLVVTNPDGETIAVSDDRNQTDVDTNNSVSTTISDGSSWTGTATDLLGYVSLTYTIVQDPAGAAGESYFEFSSDGTNWDVSIPTDLTDQPFILPLPLAVVNRYFRARVTNTSGSDFDIVVQTLLHRSSPPDLTQLASQSITDTTPLKNVRSIATGENPDSDYSNIRASGRHAANSTSASLGVSGVYRGEWFPWQGSYVGLLSDFEADQSGTFYIDFSQDDTPSDGDDLSVDVSIVISYNPSDGLVRRITPVQSKWVRHRYVNGGVAQTVFNLDAAFTTAAPPLMMVGLRQNVDENQLAGLTRSVLSAENDSSVYGNIGRGDNGGLDIGIVEHEVDTPIESLTTFTTAGVTVLNSATRIDSSQLANRKAVSLKATTTNNKRIFIGEDNTVTTSTGYPLSAGASLDIDLTDDAEIWGIADGSSQSLFIIQAA